MPSIFSRMYKISFTDNTTGQKNALYNIAKTLGIILISILIAEVLRFLQISEQCILMLYLVAVVVISYITPSFKYGCIASILSTFTFDYFITNPRLGFSFTIGIPVTLITMLILTFLISTLTAQLKVQARLALEREQHTQLLYEINQRLLVARDMKTIIKLTNEYLLNNLHCPIIFYIRELSEERERIYFESASETQQTDIFHTEEAKEKVRRIFDQDTGSTAALWQGVFYVPLISKGRVLGVIGIACSEDEWGSDKLSFIKIITGQVTMALDLQYYADEQIRVRMEAEKEKMRGNLLRSISHDLRTPLTNTLITISTLLNREMTMNDSVPTNLIEDIRDNTQWLLRMVENLLIVTRISGNDMKVKKTMEATEEVVAQAVSIVRKRFPSHHFKAVIPDELFMVPMDATLISQVIINLMENAAKNSNESALILLELTQNGQNAQFTISDNGNGIPESLLGNLFEPHSPGETSLEGASKGMGIGLSICQTIIKAHGGVIQGQNRSTSGARFIFWLPLQEDC